MNFLEKSLKICVQLMPFDLFSRFKNFLGLHETWKLVKIKPYSEGAEIELL